MIIHLIRSEEFKTDSFNWVLTQLNSFTDQVKFVGHSISKVQYNSHDSIKEWDEFFSYCVEFRSLNKLKDNEVVILLTEHENVKKWFGWTDESLCNYFVQTSQWNEYFPDELNNHFPVLYEIVSWVLRSIMFDDRDTMLESAHKVTRGCMMDFCQKKSEVIIKMRTADLCTDCSQVVQNRRIEPKIISEFFNLFEGIRKNLIFRERFHLSLGISKIQINLRADKSSNRKVFLTEIQNSKVNVGVIETAIYVLFLKHPKGIFLKDLVDFKNELYSIYSDLKNGVGKKEYDKTFDNLVVHGDVNTRISNIKKEFDKILGPSIADQYIIQKVSDGKSLIKLDRKLVSIIE